MSVCDCVSRDDRSREKGVDISACSIIEDKYLIIATQSVFRYAVQLTHHLDLIFVKFVITNSQLMAVCQSVS